MHSTKTQWKIWPTKYGRRYRKQNVFTMTGKTWITDLLILSTILNACEYKWSRRP